MIGSSQIFGGPDHNAIYRITETGSRKTSIQLDVGAINIKKDSGIVASIATFSSNNNYFLFLSNIGQLSIHDLSSTQPFEVLWSSTGK